MNTAAWVFVAVTVLAAAWTTFASLGGRIEKARARFEKRDFPRLESIKKKVHRHYMRIT